MSEMDSAFRVPSIWSFTGIPLGPKLVVAELPLPPPPPTPLSVWLAGVVRPMADARRMEVSTLNWAKVCSLASTTRLGIWVSTTRRSRRKEPKKGTTSEWGMSSARITESRYSSLGRCSVSSTLHSFLRRKGSSRESIDSQKGFSLSDLPGIAQWMNCLKIETTTHLRPANISTAELKLPRFQQVWTIRMMQESIAFLLIKRDRIDSIGSLPIVPWSHLPHFVSGLRYDQMRYPRGHLIESAHEHKLIGSQLNMQTKGECDWKFETFPFNSKCAKKNLLHWIGRQDGWQCRFLVWWPCLSHDQLSGPAWSPWWLVVHPSWQMLSRHHRTSLTSFDLH